MADVVTGNRILSILREIPDETIRFTVGAHDVGVARNRIAAVVSTVLASGTVCDADGAIIHIGDEVMPFATIEGGRERQMGFAGIVVDIVDNVVVYEPHAADEDGEQARYYASSVVVTKRSVPRETGAPAAFADPADHAKVTALAKNLYNIGFNGPRHGGFPRITGNLMCEAAEAMLKLLGEPTFAERLGLVSEPNDDPDYRYQFMVNGRTLRLDTAEPDDLRAGLKAAIDAIEHVDDAVILATEHIRRWRSGRSIDASPAPAVKREIEMSTRIVLKREDDDIVADTPDRPGMVPIGYGANLYEALGRWLHGNRNIARVTIDVDDSAWPDEIKRREMELSDR